jgi:hypothetical protein
VTKSAQAYSKKMGVLQQQTFTDETAASDNS